MKATLQAIEYYLPERVLSNRELAEIFPEWPAEKIEAKLGIRERRIAGPDETSLDLAVAAANRLFQSGAVGPGDIDYLLFCTQSPDYWLPTSACVIQSKLGLPTSCGALDFNLGCSGWVYGLSLAKGLIESGQAHRVLFLTGETYSKFLDPSDKATRTLFGDGAAATLVGAVDSAEELIGPFVFGTNGSGAEHLMVRGGGSREPALDTVLCMNGGEIFSFSLREVSASVAELLSRTGRTWDSVDLCVFHQANSYMLGFLRQKCGIPEQKFFTHFAEVGNTVSNTIPIALHHATKEGRAKPGDTLLCSGFGVGLSWATCLLRLPV